MSKKSRTTATLRIARVALAIFACFILAGCATTYPITTESEVTLKGNVKVSQVFGSLRAPDSLALLCVENHAFLYAYEGHNHQGGPAMSRFPEWDKKC